jgi:hypothetical protein
MLKAFAAGKEQLIKGGTQYLRELSATGNSFSLETSALLTFSWPSATDGLGEFGNNKTENL